MPRRRESKENETTKITEKQKADLILAHKDLRNFEILYRNANAALSECKSGGAAVLVANFLCLFVDPASVAHTLTFGATFGIEVQGSYKMVNALCSNTQLDEESIRCEIANLSQEEAINKLNGIKKQSLETERKLEHIQYQFFIFLALGSLLLGRKNSVLFCLSFVILMTSYNYGNSRWKKIKLNDNIKNVEKNLHLALLNLEDSTIHAHPGQTLVLTLFEIKFHKFGSITKFAVCQIVKNAFLKYGLDIVQFNLDSMIVKGDLDLSNKTAKKINALILKQLNELKNGKLFKKSGYTNSNPSRPFL